MVRRWVNEGAKKIALVGRTARDVRDVMVEGESGILNVFPRHERPLYRPSKSRIYFRNGAVAYCYSAEKPDQTRGPQFFKAWVDELAAWQRPEALENLIPGIRLGNAPQIVATTTPKPVKLVKELVKDSKTIITRGRTRDNRENLPDAFLREMDRKYAGTRLGRQELEGELLEDTPGALWTAKLIEDFRASEPPALQRIVVGVDPSINSGEEGDEAGIIVAGKNGEHAYVLEDCSIEGSPLEWARTAVEAYKRHRADRVVAESNQGGEMVRLTLQTVDAKVPVKLVWASKGKYTRAEPVAALYEQGRVHHVGYFGSLESEMCTYVPGADEKSPNRMDALVWALTELMLDEPAVPRIRSL